MDISLAELESELADLAEHLARVEAKLHAAVKASESGAVNYSLANLHGRHAGPPFTTLEDIRESHIKYEDPE